MTSKKRGLGRGLNDLGLDELLSSVQTSVPIISASAATRASEIREIPVDLLKPGRYQPRRDFDPEALQELADSIRSQGIIQPIIARPLTKGDYEIIAGERRWRAAQLAGQMSVPVIVRDLSDDAALAIGLIENLQRENLNVIEEAMAFQRLIKEFGMTHEQVGEVVGKKSRSAVSNTIRLLNLHHEVRTMLERGDLEMGHGRALLALSDEQQSSLARIVITKEMSVRETERLVKNTLANKADKAPEVMDPNLQRLQSDLTDKLGAKVSIQHKKGGKGKLVIQYNSLDELDGILGHLH